MFRYSGGGQLGGMKFTGGKKAIRDAAKDGKDLHLFRQGGRGHVQYVGCLSCSSREHLGERAGAWVITRPGVAT